MTVIKKKLNSLRVVSEKLLENGIKDKLCTPEEVSELIDYTEKLEATIKGLLIQVVPHVRDTGHNAADREMHSAIKAAREFI